MGSKWPRQNLDWLPVDLSLGWLLSVHHSQWIQPDFYAWFFKWKEKYTLWTKAFLQSGYPDSLFSLFLPHWSFYSHYSLLEWISQQILTHALRHRVEWHDQGPPSCSVPMAPQQAREAAGRPGRNLPAWTRSQGMVVCMRSLQNAGVCFDSGANEKWDWVKCRREERNKDDFWVLNWEQNSNSWIGFSLFLMDATPQIILIHKNLYFTSCMWYANTCNNVTFTYSSHI